MPDTEPDERAGPDTDVLPVPCLVVLVGPSASGKTTWADAHFSPPEVVSSDRLRAVVGHGEDDLDATDAAFGLLDQIVEQRLGRRLTTVVDTLGLDPQRRAAYREAAARHRVPCVAVGFDITPVECRARNRTRPRPVPADALRRQLASWAQTRDLLATEGFDRVLDGRPVRPVAPHLHVSSTRGGDRRTTAVGLRFGLHLSAFPWPAERLADALRPVAQVAEAVGFDSLWVMDHLRQIPQVGRDWDAMAESYTTLAWLAACTSRVRLGALVTAVTFRNVAHLGKIIATLDGLSGGRAVCGLGAGWYEREHRAYGWPMPPAGERLDLLEDALQVLPMVWGPGAPAFRGKVIEVPEAICYPRPLQEHVPILVGGGGERRTLRLVARYADAANLLGDAATVARKVEVLRRHCADVDRDPAAVEVTHLSTTLVGADRVDVEGRVDRLRPRRVTPSAFDAQVNAGTVTDQVDRFRHLADLGVQTAIVSLPELGGVADPAEAPAAVERFAPVIAALR